LLLNTKNRITHEALVYRGTVNSIYIRPAELFKEAVRVNAPALLLSHVHPSGDPTPSPEDVRVTELSVQAGKLLGIDVLDHLIIGNDVWFSLKESGFG
jgi:DNA repair protein RadC